VKSRGTMGEDTLVVLDYVLLGILVIIEAITVSQLVANCSSLRDLRASTLLLSFVESIVILGRPRGPVEFHWTVTFALVMGVNVGAGFLLIYVLHLLSILNFKTSKMRKRSPKCFGLFHKVIVLIFSLSQLSAFIIIILTNKYWYVCITGSTIAVLSATYGGYMSYNLYALSKQLENTVRFNSEHREEPPSISRRRARMISLNSNLNSLQSRMAFTPRACSHDVKLTPLRGPSRRRSINENKPLNAVIPHLDISLSSENLDTPRIAPITPGTVPRPLTPVSTSPFNAHGRSLSQVALEAADAVCQRSPVSSRSSRVPPKTRLVPKKPTDPPPGVEVRVSMDSGTSCTNNSMDEAFDTLAKRMRLQAAITTIVTIGVTIASGYFTYDAFLSDANYSDEESKKSTVVDALRVVVLILFTNFNRSVVGYA